MLAIESDGTYHTWEETFARDDERQKRLESLGLTVIRFTEADTKGDMLNVLRAIEAAIIAILKTQPDIKLPVGFDISLLEY